MDYSYFEERRVAWYRTRYGGWIVTLSIDGDTEEFTAASSEREARRAVRYVLGVDRLPPVRRDGGVRIVEMTVTNNLSGGGLPDGFV